MGNTILDTQKEQVFEVPHHQGWELPSLWGLGPSKQSYFTTIEILRGRSGQKKKMQSLHFSRESNDQ